MKNGLFISFEGGEGCGKSTICEYLVSFLENNGYDVLYTREPGGSDIAEQIRNVILDKNNTAMEAKTEALLYAAARRQHYTEIIIPALKAGKIVICDRFIDSSLAYQGIARGIGIESVYEINKFAIGERLPDLTIYLKVKPEIGLSRISTRNKSDRLDVETLDFHNRVFEGYDKVCQMFPNRIKVINAENPLNQVKTDTLREVMNKVKENV